MSSFGDEAVATHHLVTDIRAKIASALGQEATAGQLIRVADAGQIPSVATSELTANLDVVAWLTIRPGEPAHVFAPTEPLPPASELELITVSVTRTSGPQVVTNVHAMLVRRTVTPA